VKNSSASGRAAYLPSQYFELSIVIAAIDLRLKLIPPSFILTE